MLKVRFADNNHADSIVSMIKNSFIANVIDATIYGCKGMQLFVKEQISVPNNLADTIYIVAEKDSEIIGCIEFRKIQDIIFLNYICTSQKSRHKGLGRIMLREAILMARKTHHKKISLDVFCDNKIAKTWYKKLGWNRNDVFPV